jgi:hypothetical protein
VGREKRKGNIPIPGNLKEFMNEAQWKALSGIEYTGWRLRFVRRPLFQEPVLFIQNTNNGQIGILDKDGNVKIQRTVKVREQGGARILASNE